MAEQCTSILSGSAKSKLQAKIAEVEFVNTVEAHLYRCNKCAQLAIYHYIAICKHVFCGKCHSQCYKKPCPVENCKNKSLDSTTQSVDFEFGMYKLVVFCLHQKSGCGEKITLANLLVHLKACKFSSKNLLPRLWVPPPKSEYVKQLEEEVEVLKNSNKDILATVEQFKNCFEELKVKMDKKVDAITTELKDDITFNLTEKLVRNIDKKAKEIEIATSGQLQQQHESDQEKLMLQINMKIDEMRLGLAVDVTDQVAKNIDLKAKELEQISSRNFKVEQEKVILQMNVMRHDLESDILEKLLRNLDIKTEEFENKLVTIMQDNSKTEEQKFIQITDIKMEKMKIDLAGNAEKLMAKIDTKIQEFEKSSEEIKDSVKLEQDKLNKDIAMQISVLKHDLTCDLNDQQVKNIDLKIQEIEKKMSKSIQEELEREHEILNKQVHALSSAQENNISKSRMEIEAEIERFTEKFKKDQVELQEKTETLNRGTLVMKQHMDQLKIQIKELTVATGMQLQNFSRSLGMAYKYFWKISNFSNVKDGNVNQLSKTFISTDLKYSISAIFVKESFGYYQIYTTCSCYARESRDYHYQHQTTILVLDQSNGNILRHICRVDEPKFQDKTKHNNVFIHAEAIRKDHIQNNSILIKIIIEPFLENSNYSSVSQDGILVWKIENYENLKQTEKDYLSNGIYSNYFLTSTEGYRMKISLFMYADYIYIALIFVHGEFDYQLSDKFHHKTTFMIMDQSGEENRMQLEKSLEKDSNESIDYEIFKYTDFETPNYLRDDCIILKVTVETLSF